MEGDSYVRGERLYHYVTLRHFPDGASFLYDGSVIVGQSVDRVRIPSYTHKSSALLLIDITHRGHRSCTSLSTTALGLSVSLKGLRR
jgi:hypothetical protein